MNRREALNLLEKTAATLEKRLGEDFRAFFAFGSVLQNTFHPQRSNLNTLLVVRDSVEINLVRAAFAPIWSTAGGQLRRAPLILREREAERFCGYFPLLAEHLAQGSRQLAGTPWEIPPTARVTTAYRQAVFGNQLLKAARLLGAPLLAPEHHRESLVTLERLVRRSGIDMATSRPAVMVARLVEIFGEDDRYEFPTEDPPYGIEGLVAVYEMLGHEYLVVRAPADIGSIRLDQAVEELAAQDISSLTIATVPQFRAVMPELYPLDVRLRGLTLFWGSDLLADFEPDPAAIVQQAGRFAALHGVDILPNALLTSAAKPAVDSKLIHDFQNKLLNNRLQNELLSRLGYTTPAEPFDLPDRHAPAEVRLQAIWEQFLWWAEFFELERHDVDPAR